MKRLLFASLVWLATVAATMAQMKGHSYYNWVGTLDNKINVEIFLEIDGLNNLALGEIDYFRKDGGTSKIQLYGCLDKKGEDNQHDYLLMEHLPDGKMSGLLGLRLQHGKLIEGHWLSTDLSRHYQLNVTKTKPFPYDKWSTFYQPISRMSDVEGVYRNVAAIGQTNETNNLCIIINKNDGADLTKESEEGKFHMELTNNNELGLGQDISPTPYGEFNFIAPTDDKCTIMVYRDFAILTTQPKESDEKETSLFFIRQPNEKIVGAPGFECGIWAKLKDGKALISFNKAKIEKELDGFYEDLTMCPDGEDLELMGVDSTVRDIYCGDIGQDTHPILALILDNGKVQIYSPFKALEDGHLRVSRPLWNMEGIYQCSTQRNPPFGEDEILDYVTFYGISYYDEKTPEVFPCHYIDGNWQISTGKGLNQQEVSIEFTEEWWMQYHQQTGDPAMDGSHCHNYYGYCQPIDEEQTTYKYVFEMENDSREQFADQPSALEGTFRVDEVDYIEDGVKMTLTPLTGNLLFGAKKLGQSVTLRKFSPKG